MKDGEGGSIKASFSVEQGYKKVGSQSPTGFYRPWPVTHELGVVVDMLLGRAADIRCQ